MITELRALLLMRSYATLPPFFNQALKITDNFARGNTGEKIYLGVRGRDRIGVLMIADSFNQAGSNL